MKNDGTQRSAARSIAYNVRYVDLRTSPPSHPSHRLKAVQTLSRPGQLVRIFARPVERGLYIDRHTPSSEHHGYGPPRRKPKPRRSGYRFRCILCRMSDALSRIRPFQACLRPVWQHTAKRGHGAAFRKRVTRRHGRMGGLSGRYRKNWHGSVQVGTLEMQLNQPHARPQCQAFYLATHSDAQEGPSKLPKTTPRSFNSTSGNTLAARLVRATRSSPCRAALAPPICSDTIRRPAMRPSD